MDDTLYVVAGAAAGGLVNGFAGFGTALFALGFFLAVVPPTEAVAIVVVLSVVAGLQGVWIVRREIGRNPVRLARFLLPALAGIPVGITLLSAVDARSLKLLVASILVLYGGYFCVNRSLPSIRRPTPLIDVSVGFLGGVLGGAASLSGALPTMWCALRDWPRAETRAVLQPFNVAVLAVTAALLAWRGAYERQTLVQLAWALPVALAAAQVGIAMFHRVSDATFRRVLIGLTLTSGSVLALRELL